VQELYGYDVLEEPEFTGSSLVFER
jgi:hypothetical protein